MSETRSMIEGMVTRLLSDHVTPTMLADAEAGGWQQGLWDLVEQQGLTQSLATEEMGGMGVTWQDTYAIVRAAGRYSAPLPLPETIVAGWLLAMGGLGIPKGPLGLAGAHPEDVLELKRVNNGWRLSGVARRVPWGRIAGSMVFALTCQGNPVVVKAPREGSEVVPGRNVAGDWRDSIHFSSHPVEVAPLDRQFAMGTARTVGGMIRSGQMAGAFGDLLDRSVAYANERSQFGRLIGKYQAIQHNLAVLATEVAAADVAAEAAFLSADQGDPSFLAAVAKVRLGTAVAKANGIAHQIHGAMGFTLEHPLQLASRRLMSWRAEFGADRQWSVMLGQKVLEQGADGFWPQLTVL